jgi:hypothetical protein
MITTTRGARRPRAVVLIGAAAAALTIGLTAGCGDDAEVASAAAHADTAAHATASPQLHSDSAHAFQDDMRELWEDHVTWTRLAIVSIVDDLPDQEATVARLLRNQDDIGDAIAPYYGREAGDRLTALLREHITGAAALLAAAKSGEDAAVEAASGAWYRNGDQVADFLAGANPDAWPKDVLRGMMRTHLDDTLAEATLRMQGDHAAEVRVYDKIHAHILRMADALSDGIEAQFPNRFA